MGIVYHNARLLSSAPVTQAWRLQSPFQVGFGAAQPPQDSFFGWLPCGKAARQPAKEEIARVADPRAPDFATAMVTRVCCMVLQG
jgi:hypothetical protein